MASGTDKSRLEIEAVCHGWQQHFDLLVGKVNPAHLDQARATVVPDYFSWEPFHLSPTCEYIGEELYSLLTCAPPGMDKDALLICRLTADKLQDTIDEADPGRWDRDPDDNYGRLFDMKIALAGMGYPAY